MNDTARNCLQATIKKIEGAYAPSTIRAYKSNFENFIKYCDETNEEALPASSEIVASFIKSISDGRLKSASIRIAVASIASIHKLNRLKDPVNDPDVKLEMRRMHRKLGRESKQAYGINKAQINKMINFTTNDLRGLRDRALLYFAYDTMCRRGEITSLLVEDLIKTEGLARIKLRKSKTDQEQLGQWLHLSEESIKAVKLWLTISKITHGKLFRGIKKDQTINTKLTEPQINHIYKKYAKLIGLDIFSVSGHSVRVGATQDLVASGESLPLIMNKGRLTKVDTAIKYSRNLKAI